MLGDAVMAAAATKDDATDIVNVTIDELVRQRYELPGFTTLLKAAKRARIAVNSGYHQVLRRALGKAGRARIGLLVARN